MDRSDRGDTFGLECALSLDSDESEVCSDDSENYETASIISDDSVYPDYDHRDKQESTGALTFYQACAQNNIQVLKEKIEQGVTEEEVTEVNANGRDGLMVACYRNFIDVVVLLSHCSYLDINHQDNDGNTPLMIAAQAGHVTVVTYLLNYYPEIHIEQTDNRGFTALIKAAMQGRTECVTALLMAGACLNAIDLYRGKTAKEWALITGRFETFVHINRLIQRPCAEQFCDKYIPEWPQLKDLVAKATAIKTRRERLSEKLRSAFSINFPHDPEDNGVMDHAVRITTSLSSPFITTACQTICPSSPPALEKRRFAVPEIMQQLDICKKLNFKNEARKSADSSSLEIPSKSSLMSERRTNIFSVTSPVAPGMGTSGGMSFIPTRLMRRNSIFPDDCIPKIKLIKASPPTRKKDKKQKTKNKHYLEPPKWRYKELKEEKKRAEELEEERKEKEAKKNK